VSGQYPAWLGAVAASVTWIFLGLQTRLLALPVLNQGALPRLWQALLVGARMPLHEALSAAARPG